MPTPVEAVVVAVGFALAWGAVVAFTAALCGTNTRSERRERLRPAARASERALTLGWTDHQLEARREQHYAATDRYADMDTMARARMRGDRNLVETRPVAARRGRAA